MSYEPQLKTGYAATREVDAGLQSYMQGVYRLMGLGLVVTGLTAYAVASFDPLFKLIFGTPLKFVALLAPMAFIWLGFTPARIAKLSPDKLRMTFILFSAVMGLSLSVLLQIFTGASVAQVFFITAATFAATSLYGYTTKRDLAGVGSFMFMGLVGIVIASVVNLFMESKMIHFAVSILGVLIFTGLTAWETQRLKEVYSSNLNMAEANAKMAVMGALSLYLNFINLFQSLLSLMGSQRN